MTDIEIKALTDQIAAEVKAFNLATSEMRKLIDDKAPAAQITELVNKANAGEISIKKLSEQLDAIQLQLKDKPMGKSASLFGEFKKAYMASKLISRSHQGRWYLN